MTTEKVTLYLFRHGQTDWAVTGQHTGRTDIPLNEHGRVQSQRLKTIVEGLVFTKTFVSPLSRARDTATIAGIGDERIVCEDLAEFDYGRYEGLTTDEIRKAVPDWTIWTHPCPGGETLQEASERCRRVIDTARGIKGNVALVAHGHILRILTATWLDLPPSEGKHFILETSTISVLSYERETPAIKIWNAAALSG